MKKNSLVVKIVALSLAGIMALAAVSSLILILLQ